MPKININFFKGFGDTLICSPAIKQLKEEYGYEIAVDGLGAKEIYAHNPDCTTSPIQAEKSYIPHDLLLKHANNRPIHQLEWPIFYFNLVLGVNMQLKYNKCFIYLTDQEKQGTYTKPYILLNAEFQNNFTVKKYHRWQEVIDLLSPMIDIFQIGLKRDYKLKNVTNLTGMTNIRYLFTLAYNAQMCLGGESFLNHICSAFNKPYILVASGFSPKNYYSYPNTTILNKSHSLHCGEDGCCWRNRVQVIHDGAMYNTQICLNSLKIKDNKDPQEDRIAKCMDLIEPEDIVTACLPYITA